MKTLYLECNMGAAGDMLMAALSELVEDKQAFVDEMNAIGLEKVTVSAKEAVKCGITGTHMEVLVDGEEELSHDHEHHDHDHHEHHDHEHHDHDHHDHEHHDHERHEHHEHHDHEHHEHHEHDHHDHDHHDHHEHDHHELSHHHHAGMHDIEHILSHLNIPEEVRKDSLAVYNLIAEAESHAHGRPIDQIHFHEVGTIDAVTDVVGVCLLIHKLAVDQIIVSPVHVGSGQVRCAHGILPVPTPATAYILKDAPIYSGAVRGELCTPTGAALLKHFANKFGVMPVMRVSKIGYGMGNKDFEQANCVRALLGETQEQAEQILELCCNIDDMTAEELGFVMEILFTAGALDVFTMPIGMKKSRPATLLTCMCKLADREKMLQLLFKHTTTLGVRESICNRYTLQRSERTEETPYGPVRVKQAKGFGVVREKAEYEDLAAIAKAQNLGLRQVRDMI